ncbi:MAG: chorismate synthase [Bacilli bacterium]|nr:chorismate synthase [Bacilli bacterium]
MKNTIGDNLTLTLFGESHGSYIGAVLDGISAGIKVDEDFIKAQLSRRRPQSKIETARIEEDEYIIASGVFNGYTTGSPIALMIPNKNVNSKDYDELKNVARPSHADFAAYIKYHGFADYRGGGHFSGRITAPIVALASILIKALEKKNIYIGTHILKCGKYQDEAFKGNVQEIKTLKEKTFPILTAIEEEIKTEILECAKNGDSIGGILQTEIIGLPAGLGDPWFSSVEGKLSNALFSIGGIKGVEFGLGFGFGDNLGSKCNDEFEVVEGLVKTKTNNNGGINGGITNGMPVVFNCAVKPTPSISLPQNTIDFVKNENVSLSIKGRHDPAIIRRMAVVVDSITALVVADMLVTKYGVDFLRSEE